MGQLYVPDGALTTCLSGKINSTIKVSSQSSIKINSKLKATEKDRFTTNFECVKMTTGASAIMGAVGGAIGALGGPVGAFVGYCAGKFLGGLFGNKVSSSLLPNLCSTMCMPSKWTVVHPKVKLEGKKALLEKANIRCFVGGIISIVLPNKAKALAMAAMAGDAYNSEAGEAIDGYSRVSDERAEELLGKEWKKMLDQNNKNGFYAALYEDKDGNITIAYRGTEVGKNDIKEDVVQAMGWEAEQYKDSVDLARKIQQAKNEGLITGDVEITGHSLGGGLATIAGAATGYPTYTYNAAAVHENTYDANDIDGKNTTHIQSYIGDKDPLNSLQDNREAFLSGAVLVSPTLPIIGGTVGSLGGALGTNIGIYGGGGVGILLSGLGTYGLLTGGMPRQEDTQRIIVPQDRTWGTGHGIGDLKDDMEIMFKAMGAGDPVMAQMEIAATSLSRKTILKEATIEWWTGEEEYKGSGWGHGPRQAIANILGLDNNVSNIVEAGVKSVLQFDEVNLTGQALEKVKKDKGMMRVENELVEKIKGDPRYGKEAFSYKERNVVGFGGDRAPYPMEDQMKDPFNPKYRDTWNVAGDELTWLVRNTNVTSATEVSASGSITINHSFTDVFDLRPGEGRTGIYNDVTTVTGVAYHDIVGGNDELKINAKWTSKR